MSETRASLRYAKAILNFSLDQNKEEEVNNDMRFIATTVDESKELQSLLNSPILKNNIKKEALTKVFSNHITALSYGLIDLLIDKKRLPILMDVAKKYNVIFDALKGKEIAKVTTAVPLTDALNEEVLNKVKEITGKMASIENNIDPKIIGGFILRIGDIQYDASIANKLQLLKREFENGSYVSQL